MSNLKSSALARRVGAWSGVGAMAAFVLLWGGSAIVTRAALDHGSASAVLLARYGIALLVLLAMCARRGRLGAPVGSRMRIVWAGLVMVAGYSVCYFESMARGITPGMLAIVQGVQPVLTLLLQERRFNAMRLCGLLLALAGLAMVVWQGVMKTRLDVLGLWFAMAALACITLGAIMQKRIQQEPMEVLPLQFAVTVGVCLLFTQVQPLQWENTAGFWLPVVFLGVVTSVFAQLLLYRLIQRGNLVNVTSLFYLVPAVTAALDFLVLGNALSALALLGMCCILAGVVAVHRR